MCVCVYLQWVLLSVLWPQRLTVVGEVDHSEWHCRGHRSNQHGLHHLQTRAMDVPNTHTHTQTHTNTHKHTHQPRDVDILRNCFHCSLRDFLILHPAKHSRCHVLFLLSHHKCNTTPRGITISFYTCKKLNLFLPDPEDGQPVVENIEQSSEQTTCTGGGGKSENKKQLFGKCQYFIYLH